MNTPQTKIVELFDRLSSSDRQELAEHLYQRSRPDFLSAMKPEHRAELDAGLAEADRGEGAVEADVFRRLEQKFGVKLG
jgi:Mg/Co/Ni transporter MgtE